MGVEKRKSRRKVFERSGLVKLSEDGPAEPCIVLNVSDTGARLACTAPRVIPEQFLLALSADGMVTRQCSVVWRSGFELGVEFSRPSARQAGSLPAPSKPITIRPPDKGKKPR
jgi:PilZ domain